MTFYKGSSLFGNRSDFISEGIKKNEQEIQLKKELAADVELKKEYFILYLKHSYALYNLAINQQMLSNNIERHFDGQAKIALNNRLDDNIQQAYTLNKTFESFLKPF